MATGRPNETSNNEGIIDQFSKSQLDAILSALEGTPRNPANKSAALRAIGRHAESIGLTIEDVLATAAGLLDGRMSAEAFRTALRDDAVAGESDGAADAKRFIDSLGDEPASATESDVDDEPVQDAPATMDGAEPMPVTETASSFDRPAEDAPQAPVAADGRKHCPHCGRVMPKRREPKVRKREPREPGSLIPPRPGSKEAFVIEMLQRPEGATIAQIMHETGWLAHTTRSVITAAIGHKRGYDVFSERPAGTRERVYRIAG